jgi:alpha-glucosidase
VANYVRPDELHQAFNFSYLGTAWEAGAQRAMIDASLAANDAVGAPTTWTLSNHDVVRHTHRLMQVNQGDVAGRKPTPVDQVAGLRRARAASLLLLALPGSAYLYQGEELGLPESTDMPDEFRQDPTFARTHGKEIGRDGCRVPIPWVKDAPSFGFGPSDQTWLPQPAQYGEYAVDQQEGVEGSTLELYRDLLRIRRERALGTGGLLGADDTGGDVVALGNTGDNGGY